MANQTVVSDNKEEILSKIDVLIKVFRDKIDTACGKVNDDSAQDEDAIIDCEEAEYENAGNFISKIDETLKESIGRPDSGKTVLLLGYLDLQSLFNTRVSQLFEDQLCCQMEVESIKKIYM